MERVSKVKWLEEESGAIGTIYGRLAERPGLFATDQNTKESGMGECGLTYACHFQQTPVRAAPFPRTQDYQSQKKKGMEDLPALRSCSRISPSYLHLNLYGYTILFGCKIKRLRLGGVRVVCDGAREGG